jgi:hypothetical protein
MIIFGAFPFQKSGALSYSFLTAPKDDKELLMADVVRVLSLASGKLWVDELYAELNAFRETLDRGSALSDKDVRKSTKALEALDIVTTEERVAANSGAPRPTLLVALNRSEPLAKLLLVDGDIRRYRAIASAP